MSYATIGTQFTPKTNAYGIETEKDTRTDLGRLLAKHTEFKSGNYDTEIRHAREFLDEILGDIKHAKGAKELGARWLDPDTKGSFPCLTVPLIEEFTEWLLKKYKKGSLDNTCAAMDHWYVKHGQPPQWAGRFEGLKKGYIAARLELAIERGEVQAAGVRTAVPERVIIFLLELGEQAPIGSTTKSFCALLCMAYVGLLRASSLWFERDDVKFADNGDLVINSSVLKARTRAHKHRKDFGAPKPEAPPNHPRVRMFKLIKQCLSHDPDALRIVDCQTKAATTITAWMEANIPQSVHCLPPGLVITSHSFRKAGASAMFAIGLDPRRHIMPWGPWASQDSFECYLIKGFAVTSFSGAMWDWYPLVSYTYAWKAVATRSRPNPQSSGFAAHSLLLQRAAENI